MTNAKDWITAQPPVLLSEQTETPVEEDAAFREALALAKSLHRKHYSEVTQWEPLGDTVGLLTQIDNMTACLVRQTPAQETGGDVERVARAIVSELVGPNEWKEMGAAEIQTACDAARAALSAMHPSVSVDWERIEQIKHQHIATSHDIEHGNHRWDDFSAEAIHADRAFLLSLIEQSLPIAAARGEG